MPSDSIAGFLDQAQAVRVLHPEQIEQLIRQPDIPQSDLTKLCEYLLSRGVLTRFQADAIRGARGQELNFAGYPIVDVIGPCPGGMAYKALHPSLRTPVILRRLRADWLAPLENGASYVNRVRAIGMCPHPNAVPVLDAGFYCDEPYVVIDPPTGTADLQTLTAEVGGAMPGFLAAEYGRAVASVLRLVHHLGGVHGDVRPANLLVGPLIVRPGADGLERRRPAPDAVVRLAEVGLVPLRPPASQLMPDLAVLPYLPPERVDSNVYNERSDIYGLGATLYYFLTGRPPLAGVNPSELLLRVRDSQPISLSVLRPDLADELVALVGQMMEKDPSRRPATAQDVESALTPFCRPGTVPPQPPPSPVPMAAPASGVAIAEAVAAAVPVEESTEAWGVDPGAFAEVHATADAAPRKRATTDADKNRTRMLLFLGGLLHLTGVSLLIAWALGAFDSPPPPEEPSPPTQKKEEPHRAPKKHRQKNPG